MGRKEAWTLEEAMIWVKNGADHDKMDLKAVKTNNI